MTAAHVTQPFLFDGVTLRHDWPFGDLRPGAYGLIMADPPWRFELWSATGEEKSAQAHYACQDLDTIKALPVAELAARHALLWLWATAPMLPQALEVMDAWGFRYLTMGWWRKTTARGCEAFGTGYRLRSCGEPFLIGAVGDPPLADRGVRNAFDGVVREHSAKPETAYPHALRLVAPSTPAVELFSRRTRAGWDTWGDEAGMLDGETV